jgi:hypothetical protein
MAVAAAINSRQRSTISIHFMRRRDHMHENPSKLTSTFINYLMKKEKEIVVGVVVGGGGDGGAASSCRHAAGSASS